MEVRIRPADGYDIEEMTKLFSSVNGPQRGLRGKMARFSKGIAMMCAGGEERMVLVAETRHQIVGMITTQLLVSAGEGGIVALAGDLTIHKSARGEGIELKLLAGAEGWAHSLGAIHTYLACPTGGGLPPFPDEAAFVSAGVEFRLVAQAASLLARCEKRPAPRASARVARQTEELLPSRK